MSQRFRLILDKANTGPWNMAVDEALLQAADASDAIVLRFYGWSEPTLSLGYFQQMGDRQTHQASIACPVVRRRSGGGAILHDHELTYSFSTSIKDRLSNSAGGVYAMFHETLVKVLGNWNIRAHLAEAKDETRHGNHAFLCFQRRSIGDVLIGEAKVAGSAQRRRRARLIQHGSLLLSESKFAPELPGIAQIEGRKIGHSELTNAWIGEIECALGHSFVKSELLREELQKTAEFQRKQFSDRSWTRRW